MRKHGSRSKIKDLIIAEGASTDSNFGAGFHTPGQISAIADYSLMENAVSIARKNNISFLVGNVTSSDTFYEESETREGWAKMSCLAAEMESYGLYKNAARTGKRALAILTVTAEMYSNNFDCIDETEDCYNNMATVGLETAVNMYEKGLLD